MAITFIQGATAPIISGSPLSATFPSDVTAGNTIIVVIAHNYLGCSPGATDCHDTLDNLYTRHGTGQSPGANQFLWMYSAPVTTSGPCTATVSYGCGTCRWAYFAEFSGIAASPYDGSNVAVSTTNDAVSGEVTTTADGDLVLSAWSGVAAPSYTAGSGTIILATAIGSPTDPKDCLQMQIQSTAGAVAPTAQAVGIGSTYTGFGFTSAWKAAASGSAFVKTVTDSISASESLKRVTGKAEADT